MHHPQPWQLLRLRCAALLHDGPTENHNRGSCWLPRIGRPIRPGQLIKMSFISMRPTFENIFAQDFNSGLFLARGHLAPNADFIFYSLMVHHGEKNKFHLVEINCNVYSIFANGHFLKIFTLSGFHISLYQCGSPVAVLQRYNIDIDIDINDR